MVNKQDSVHALLQMQLVVWRSCPNVSQQAPSELAAVQRALPFLTFM